MMVAVVVAHWRAMQNVEGSGDDAVTYSALPTALLALHLILLAPITRPMQTLLNLRFLIGYGLTVLIRTLLKHHWRLTLKHRRTQRKPQEFLGNDCRACRFQRRLRGGQRVYRKRQGLGGLFWAYRSDGGR
jgi:hypothetical protein